LGEHSEKPKEVHHRLEELYGDVPRLELFAREKYGDWDVYGDQAKESIQLI
ncbi:MAG: MT-A70 family methyltransferase, partial [Proteus mirabilis]|nr:MT-A70 family methyltransferase [Proteus mirabilis]